MIKKLATKKGNQTVFSFSDIAMITGKEANGNLVSAISYSVKKGDLIRLAKGLYALSDDYSRVELGNKLRAPSYVSLYTVLQEKGVVFQPYKAIFLVSFRSETRVVRGQKYIYRKIRDEILLNPLGVEMNEVVAKASLERAILDKIYLDGTEHLDNLRGVDWDKMSKLNEQVYQRKNITKYIKKERRHAKSENA